MRASSYGTWIPFWRRGFWRGALGRTPTAKPPEPLRGAGQLLRESREAKGLRLRDLASRTRISIAVLEALERGWKDRLPEATYLRTMLPLLEHQLDLPAGSLESVLPDTGQAVRALPPRRGLAATLFGPFTSRVLTTWRGTLLYGLLTLALLHAVNLQQRWLAASGRLVVAPIPLTPLADTVQQGGPVSKPAREVAPSLADGSTPLAEAAAGQAMGLLAQESQNMAVDFSLGVLDLQLDRPTWLELRSPRGGNLRLKRLEGTVSLPVLPPFELRLHPDPPSAAVRWRGRPLAWGRPPALPGKAAPGQERSRVYAVPASGVPGPGSPPSRP